MLSKYIKPIKIGYVEVKNNVFLAPMAGVTDVNFRYICNKYGGVVYTPTEMVSTKGLVYNDKKTHKIMDGYKGESPRVVQIFGSDIEALKKVVDKFNEDDSIDIIDFNMGCPAPKVVKNGDGSELLKDLKKAEERAHILEGLKIALDNIDEVINILRSSKSIPEGKERLSHGCRNNREPAAFLYSRQSGNKIKLESGSCFRQGAGINRKTNHQSKKCNHHNLCYSFNTFLQT